MRTLAIVLILTFALAGQAAGQGLSVFDFYQPIGSRTAKSYKNALEHFNGQRFTLYQNKNLGYQINGYLYTREMVVDHIQALIDEYNVAEPDVVQRLIDRYAYYTPEEGQILVFTYFEAPHMQNRFYKDLLDTWRHHVYFEFGVQQIQNRIEDHRRRLEHYGEEPASDEMVFNGGTYPINFDYTDDWMWTIHPEFGALEYRRVPNAYECRFEFWFSESDKQVIRDLVDNKIFPTMRLVSGRQDMFGVKEFDKRFVSWVILTVDPDYFDDIMYAQRDKMWDGAAITDPKPNRGKKRSFFSKR